MSSRWQPPFGSAMLLYVISPDRYTVLLKMDTSHQVEVDMLVLRDIGRPRFSSPSHTLGDELDHTVRVLRLNASSLTA